MKLNPQELNQIASRTLDRYNDGAKDFWEGTRGHDVSQNIAALLQYIEGDPPFTLLDFGCGPGRDLKTLCSNPTPSTPSMRFTLCSTVTTR